MRFGTHAIPRGDVLRYVVGHIEQSDYVSPLVTLGLFAMIAAAALLTVIGAGTRWTMLLVAGTFGAVALSALDDLRRGPRVRIFTFDIVTHSGEHIRFATPDAGERDRLVALLDHATAAAPKG